VVVSAAAAEPAVVVSLVPQRYFVQQICTPDINVSVMVQPGASPHTYEPKPSQMTSLAKTQIYFAIGAPFEHAWLARIGAVNPAMRIVHTEEGIEKIPMVAHHDKDEDHGAGDGEEEGLDPHIWLSPKLVKMQAEKIYQALVEAYPAKRRLFKPITLLFSNILILLINSFVSCC
jgi:zinc transport system substrate-binding protein